MLRVDIEDEIKLIKNSYETYKNSGTFNKGSSLVQRTEGSSDRDNAIPERQREWNDGVNGLHEGRTSNISPNNQEVDRNIRERGRARADNGIFQKKCCIFAKKNETLILFYLCFIILLATYMVAKCGSNSCARMP
jgi:hypothetical protein